MTTLTSDHINLIISYSGNDKFLVWHTFADISDDEPAFQQLAARFKSAEAAAGFKNAVIDCQAMLGEV